MRFEVKDACFGYGRKNILNNISLTVEDGEILSILGPNGVGKTTLLRCTMGFLKWKSGGTYLDGKSLSSIPYKEIWAQIAYVPQAKGASMSYYAEDMVLMGRSCSIGMFAQPSREDYDLTAEAMEQVGITHLRGKRCSEMSGGELQMVLIARALASRPKLLILDEPESNLDFKNQLTVLDTIRRLSREQGIAAIVNTHYPEHALDISDKGLILTKTGESFYGIAQEVINEKNMHSAFDVKVVIHNFEYNQCIHRSVIPVSTVG